jgi:signal peptidase II
VRDVQAARGAALSEHTGPKHTGPKHTASEPAAPDPAAPESAAPPSAAAVRPPRPRRTALLAVVAANVLVLDSATKVLVVAELEGRRTLELLGGQLLIRVSRNPGAAFSFAEGATIVFTVIAIAVIAVIARLAPRVRSVGWAISLGLLVGGAAGNLVDRLLRSPGTGRGAVVDFLDFLVWPSFNLADSGIVVGGLLAVLLSFRGIELDGTRRTDDA